MKKLSKFGLCILITLALAGQAWGADRNIYISSSTVLSTSEEYSGVFTLHSNITESGGVFTGTVTGADLDSRLVFDTSLSDETYIELSVNCIAPGEFKYYTGLTDAYIDHGYLPIGVSKFRTYSHSDKVFVMLETDGMKIENISIRMSKIDEALLKPEELQKESIDAYTLQKTMLQSELNGLKNNLDMYKTNAEDEEIINNYYNNKKTLYFF
jgi:hypothetical protein